MIMAGGLHGLDMQKLGYYKSDTRGGYSSERLTIEPVSQEVLDEIKTSISQEDLHESKKKWIVLGLVVALIAGLSSLVWLLDF